MIFVVPRSKKVDGWRTHDAESLDEHIPDVEPPLEGEDLKEGQHRVANVVKVEAPGIGPSLAAE